MLPAYRQTSHKTKRQPSLLPIDRPAARRKGTCSRSSMGSCLPTDSPAASLSAVVSKWVSWSSHSLSHATHAKLDWKCGHPQRQRLQARGGLPAVLPCLVQPQSCALLSMRLGMEAYEKSRQDGGSRRRLRIEAQDIKTGQG